MLFLYKILIFVELVFLFFLLRKNYNSKIENIFLKPINIALLSFILIHLIVPLIMQYNDYSRYQLSYKISSYIYANIFSFIFILILYASYNFFSKEIIIKKQYISNIKKNKFIIIITILLIPSLFFSIQNFINILQGGLEFYFKDRIASGVGRGFQNTIINNLYICFLIILSRYFLFKENRSKQNIFFTIINLFLISFIFIYYLTLGNRNSVFILLFFSIFVFFIFNRNISFKKLIPSILIFSFLFFSFSYIGQYRKYPQSTFLELYERSDVSKVLLGGLNGSFGNHENLVWLIENNDSFLYGKSYLAAITNFIPRKIWSDKPLGAGPYLKNCIYPGSYNVSKSGNSSLTTGLIIEAYMNLGYFSLLIVPFIFGAFLSIMNNFFVSLKKINIAELIIYVIAALSFSFIIFYSEFLGFFSRFIMSVIPLYMINKIFK